MSFKLSISDYTHRTEEQQRTKFARMEGLEDAPSFTPDDLPIVFRPSQRKTSDTLVAMSTGCFAKTEGQFVELLSMCRKRNMCLEGIEEGWRWRPGQSTRNAVKAWKAARIKGVSRIGGRISAQRKEATTKEAIELIREDWPKPSHEFSTKELRERCDLSLNTIKRHLGPRPIAQYNYQAKLKRKVNAKR